MAKLVVLDIGRQYLKTKADFLDEFPSVIGEARELIADYRLKKHDYILNYEGHTWFAGNLAVTESEYEIQEFKEAKVHRNTKLLAVVGMHRAVKSGDEIFLVTSQPINLHKKKNKEDLQNLLRGEYTATLNGVTKSWNVKHVIVLAEDACAAWSLPDPPKFLHVIGPGSRTTNFAFMVNRTLIDRLSGTLDLGCQMVQQMKVDLFVDSVAAKLSRRWLQQQGPVMLIGGMANDFEPEFARHYSDVFVPENPQFATVLGAYNVGVKLVEQITQKA